MSPLPYTQAPNCSAQQERTPGRRSSRERSSTPGRRGSRDRSSTPGPRHGSPADLLRQAALNSAAAARSASPQPGTQVHSAKGCAAAQQPAGLAGSDVAAAANVGAAQPPRMPLPPAPDVRTDYPGLVGQAEPGSVPQAVAGSAADSAGGGGRSAAPAAAATGTGLLKLEPLAQAELLGLPQALQAEQKHRPSDALNKQDHAKAEQPDTAVCLGATKQAPELQGQQAGSFCTHVAPLSAATAPHDLGEVKVQPAKGGTAKAATARAGSMHQATIAAQEVTSPDLQRQDRRRERSSAGDESPPLVADAPGLVPGIVGSPKVRRDACCGCWWRLTPAWLRVGRPAHRAPHCCGFSCPLHRVHKQPKLPGPHQA